MKRVISFGSKVQASAEYLGKVVKSVSRRLADRYYQVVGVTLDGRLFLRAPQDCVFECSADFVKIVDDVKYTPVGFVKRGDLVALAFEPRSMFVIHHFYKGFIYVERCSAFYGLPFAVKSTDITHIFNYKIKKGNKNEA